jgi:hypothetical protein
MKSDRQAERIAAVCAAVGAAGVAAVVPFPCACGFFRRFDGLGGFDRSSYGAAELSPACYDAVARVSR